MESIQRKSFTEISKARERIRRCFIKRVTEKRECRLKRDKA